MGEKVWFHVQVSNDIVNEKIEQLGALRKGVKGKLSPIQTKNSSLSKFAISWPRFTLINDATTRKECLLVWLENWILYYSTHEYEDSTFIVFSEQASINQIRQSPDISLLRLAPLCRSTLGGRWEHWSPKQIGNVTFRRQSCDPDRQDDHEE